MAAQSLNCNLPVINPSESPVLSGCSGPDQEQSRVPWGVGAHLRGMTANSTPTATGLEPLLSVQELSDYLGIPVATLYDWRVDHRGPKAVKLGHALRYPESAIRDWIQEELDG